MNRTLRTLPLLIALPLIVWGCASRPDPTLDQVTREALQAQARGNLIDLLAATAKLTILAEQKRRRLTYYRWAGVGMLGITTVGGLAWLRRRRRFTD